MEQLVLIGSGLAAGAFMGYLYFRGLWWTVERMGTREHPYAILLLSFFIRSALAVAGFYLLLAIRWEMMAIGLAGFVVIRYLLIRSWGTIPVKLRESWGDEDGI